MAGVPQVSSHYREFIIGQTWDTLYSKVFILWINIFVEKMFVFDDFENYATCWLWVYFCVSFYSLFVLSLFVCFFFYLKPVNR